MSRTRAHVPLGFSSSQGSWDTKMPTNQNYCTTSAKRLDCLFWGTVVIKCTVQLWSPSVIVHHHDPLSSFPQFSSACMQRLFEFGQNSVHYSFSYSDMVGNGYPCSCCQLVHNRKQVHRYKLSRLSKFKKRNVDLQDWHMYHCTHSYCSTSNLQDMVPQVTFILTYPSFSHVSTWKKFIVCQPTNNYNWGCWLLLAYAWW